MSNLRSRYDLNECGMCGTQTLRPADVTKFTLSGSNQLAGYNPVTWEGKKCSVCGLEVAAGKH